MHGTMNVLDPTGHTTVTWDPDNAASVRDARDQFVELLARGFHAFRLTVSHEGAAVTEEKGEHVTTFDPRAGKYMMVPQLRGG